VCIGVLASGVLAASGVARAGWRIDAEGGALVPVDDISFDAGGERQHLGVDAGGSLSIGGAYVANDWIDLTAHFQASFAELQGIGESLAVYSFTSGGRVFLLPPHRVRPWVAAEIGWYRADADIDPISSLRISETDDTFGLNAGAGCDFAINQRVSLGVDIRYHNAFDALNGLQFLTTMFNVGIHFAGER
jgi:hypothetical protein